MNIITTVDNSMHLQLLNGIAHYFEKSNLFNFHVRFLIYYLYNLTTCSYHTYVAWGGVIGGGDVHGRSDGSGGAGAGADGMEEEEEEKRG